MRPSCQIAALMSGNLLWHDAPASIRSWARLSIYHAARDVLSREGKEQRRAALDAIPGNIRPHVEQEALRLWQLARK